MNTSASRPLDSAGWRHLSELEALLPRVLLTKSRGSIDRFGFLHVLAARCGYAAPRRAFADWVHGWIWDEAPTAESLAFAKRPKELNLVVRNDIEKSALEREGFRSVFVGGLPFAYVDKQHDVRNPDALLALPPHSAEVEKLKSHQQEYLDYLESMKGEFDGIYVSIFHLDWEGPMHRAAKMRGLHVIRGARPDDANSLYRVRSLFDAFKHVTSNTMGSHFVYALHAGAHFSFCGPMFRFDADMFLGNGNPHRHRQDRVARVMSLHDPDYLRERFGAFFKAAPQDGIADPLFAAQELGIDALRSGTEIVDILGWSLRGQVRGYAAGALRRFRRFGAG